MPPYALKENNSWLRALAAAAALTLIIVTAFAFSTRAQTTSYDLTVVISGSGTVTSSPTGINCGADCDEPYSANSYVLLMATPASGSSFTGWSGACSGAGLTCTVSMSSAKSVTATFGVSTTTPVIYTLTVNKLGAGSGTVISSPTGINCGADCDEPYSANSYVLLMATPASGSSFTGWSGACSGAGLTCTVSMSSAKSVTATFGVSTTTTPNLFNLSVTKQGPGGGRIISSPSGIDCGTACDDDFDSGDTVILIASADDDSSFAGWGKDCSGNSLTCALRMDEDKTVTAKFDLKEISGPSAPQLKTLTVDKSGPGVGGAVYSSPPGIACGVVTSSQGFINIAPFNNPFPCAVSFTAGTYLTLRALPGPASYISGWSGCANWNVYGDGTGWCLVRIGPDQTDQQVVANFEVDVVGIVRTAGGIIGVANAKTVKVEILGAGQGKVLSNISRLGGMISCEPDCQQDFTFLSSVYLQAIPDFGSYFAGWEDCNSRSNVCDFLAGGPLAGFTDGIKTVGARFELDTRRLTVSKSPSNSTEVTVSGQGINCGTDCEEDYVYNSFISLTATAEDGFAVASWSGCSSSNLLPGGGGYCMVRMTRDTNITVTVENATVSTATAKTLTVTKDGLGSGTVISSPTGINCGSDCDEDYPANSYVLLMAEPASGSSFTGWSGACGGSGPTCSVSMSSDKNVKATFGVSYTLNITKVGNGTVSVSPRTATSCGFGCFNYQKDTQITLYASPSSAFISWSGACSGSNTTCTFPMNSAKSVTATFQSTGGGGDGGPTKKLTVEVIKLVMGPIESISQQWVAGGGKVTSSPVGIDCPPTCVYDFPKDDPITITADPDEDFDFDGWLEDCSGQNICTLLMTSDKLAKATFKPATTGPSLPVPDTTTGARLKNPINVSDFPTFIRKILDIVLKVGVPIVALAIIYSGFLFVSAQGNTEKLAVARKTFFWTIVGAAIVLGAWVIAQAIGGTVEELRSTVWSFYKFGV